MTKVLVVDDEKLVRKGIIAMMNWAKFNMEVVGEAHNGRSAMEFLKQNPVDVIFTDLTMPGLSGLEFIALLREEFPALNIVVLTMHNDFEIIQQALRYDVLDYVTKAQVEREQADKILENISKRLERVLEQKKLSFMLDHNLGFDHMVAFYSPAEYSSAELEKLTEQLHVKPVQLDRNLVLFPIKSMRLINQVLSNEVVGIELIHSQDVSGASLTKIIHDYIEHELFYIYKKGCFFYSLDISAFILLPAVEDQSFKELSLEFSRDLSWVHNHSRYNQYISRILNLRMSREQLIGFFYPAYIQWTNYLHIDVAGYFEEVKCIDWWYLWKSNLDKYRALLAQNISAENTEQKISTSMDAVLKYVNEHYYEDLALEDILRIANMSKSYFSQNFKKITGKTFSDYMKEIRIQKSKFLLRETNQPIYWVAERIGYPNEKYFRKVFKELTGIQPNQYRKAKNSDTGIT